MTSSAPSRASSHVSPYSAAHIVFFSPRWCIASRVSPGSFILPGSHETEQAARNHLAREIRRDTLRGYHAKRDHYLPHLRAVLAP